MEGSLPPAALRTVSQASPPSPQPASAPPPSMLLPQAPLSPRPLQGRDAPLPSPWPWPLCRQQPWGLEAPTDFLHWAPPTPPTPASVPQHSCRVPPTATPAARLAQNTRCPNKRMEAAPTGVATTLFLLSGRSVCCTLLLKSRQGLQQGLRGSTGGQKEDMAPSHTLRPLLRCEALPRSRCIPSSHPGACEMGQ